MEDRGKTARNIAIILVLALAVWLLPGGAIAGSTVANILSVIFMGGLAFFAYRLYMEHRTTLMDLPDRSRLVLYASAAVLVFALVSTRYLWDRGGALILVWFALIGAAVYGTVAVVREWRAY